MKLGINTSLCFFVALTSPSLNDVDDKKREELITEKRRKHALDC